MIVRSHYFRRRWIWILYSCVYTVYHVLIRRSYAFSFNQ